MNRLYLVCPSPLGELTLVGTQNHLTELYMPSHKRGPRLHGDEVRDDDRFAEESAQLRGYFAGERTSFDLAVAPKGTAFQMRVWELLSEIPYGRTVTYGELARRLGAPSAARAVGFANHCNPIAIIIPCHRVVGARGALTGYAAGLHNKERLLALEAAVAHGADG